jgi:L-ascorbate metabolism protein UlaG (beta-lactamase superfamily)
VRAFVIGVALLLAACTATPLPRRSPYHASDADLGVTRIAHDSLVVEMRGTRVVVDPWFNSGLLVRHTEPLGLMPDALPPLAAVLLTHTHGDLVDDDVLRDLAIKVPEAIARHELRERLTKLGFQHVTVLEWWDTTTVGDVTVTAVPAHHGGADNGYVLEANGVSVYLAGDTTRFPELVDVATRFPSLDAALLPIGGERLLGFKREMSPSDAARVAADLGPRRIIPIGYAKSWTLLRWTARKPVESFLEECKRHGVDASRVVVLEPGESWHYYAPRDHVSGRPGSER